MSVYHPWKAECPGCSGEGLLVDEQANVWECQTCQALFSPGTSMEKALGFVDFRHSHEGPEDEIENRYFDFSILGPTGQVTDRIHGWFNGRSFRVVQFG